jgi:hypothetical protein
MKGLTRMTDERKSDDRPASVRLEKVTSSSLCAEDWRLFFDDEIDEAIEPLREFVATCVAKAMKRALQEQPFDAYFPIQWVDVNSDGIGGPAVEDPLIVYVTLPFGIEYSDNREYWKFSLKEIISEWLSLERNLRNGMVSKEDARPFLLLRDAFHDLANRIDRWVEK